MIFDRSDLELCFSEINHSTTQEFMRQLTSSMIQTSMQYRETANQQGFYIHDAHVVGLLLYPHLYTGTFQRVEIETQGTYTKGQTVVDQRNITKVATNAFVAMHVDKDLFLEAMTQDLRMFDFS